MKRDLKILVAHNVPYARTGGMSRTMGLIHDELVRGGHTVDYFCTENVPARFRGRFARFAFPLLVRQQAVAAARSGKPYDLINVHEPSAAAITRYKEAAGKPLVVAMSYGVEQRGWELTLKELSLGRGGPSRKTRIVYPLTSLWQSRVGLRWADHIFCKNTEDRDYMIERLHLSQNKITRISPGADPIYAVAAKARSYARAQRLLFAGSWIKRKGISEVAAAFGRLAMRHPRLELVVLGGGMPESVILADFALELRPRVHCVQTANEQETAEAYAAADIYLLPSLFEGTPLTLMEAMMSGLPVVTTATCGMLDTIEDERNGLLVPVRSSDRIVEAIERLIEDEQLRARLGRNAQAEALEKYTWEQVAVPVRNIYERLCDERAH